jgi:hypothetical protein
MNIEVGPIGAADLRAGRRIELDVRLGDFGRAIPPDVQASSTRTMFIRFVPKGEALTPVGRIPVWKPVQSVFGDASLSKQDVWVRGRLHEGPQPVRLGIETHVLTSDEASRLGPGPLLAQIRLDDERQASLVGLLPVLGAARPTPTPGLLAAPG